MHKSMHWRRPFRAECIRDVYARQNVLRLSMHRTMRWRRPFMAEGIGYWHLLDIFLVFNVEDVLIYRFRVKQLRLMFDEVSAW